MNDNSNTTCYVSVADGSNHNSDVRSIVTENRLFTWHKYPIVECYTYSLSFDAYKEHVLQISSSHQNINMTTTWVPIYVQDGTAYIPFLPLPASSHTVDIYPVKEYAWYYKSVEHSGSTAG